MSFFQVQVDDYQLLETQLTIWVLIVNYSQDQELKGFEDS